jgi:hypothetical protein
MSLRSLKQNPDSIAGASWIVIQGPLKATFFSFIVPSLYSGIIALNLLSWERNDCYEERSVGGSEPMQSKVGCWFRKTQQFKVKTHAPILCKKTIQGYPNEYAWLLWIVDIERRTWRTWSKPCNRRWMRRADHMWSPLRRQHVDAKIRKPQLDDWNPRKPGDSVTFWSIFPCPRSYVILLAGLWLFEQSCLAFSVCVVSITQAGAHVQHPRAGPWPYANDYSKVRTRRPEIVPQVNLLDTHNRFDSITHSTGSRMAVAYLGEWKRLKKMQICLNLCTKSSCMCTKIL